MVKQLLKGSVDSLSNHIDPQKEEQLKCVKEEIGSKVDQILTLTKNIDKGNKDAKLRRKSELTELVDDFHKQYDSLYALYDNLRGEIKQKVYVIHDDDDGDESTSNSDADIFYSPDDDDNGMHIEHDDDVLKDKVTSTSEAEYVKDLGIEIEQRGKSSCDPSSKLIDNKGMTSELSTRAHMLRDIQCATDHPSTGTDEMVEKLIAETTCLKEVISQKEEEMASLLNKHQLYESERLTRIEEQEMQLANAKQDLELSKFKSSSVTKIMNEKVSKLQAQILELRSENKSIVNSESSRDIECATAQPSTQSDETVKKLVSETSWLKGIISKKDEEIVNLSNKQQLDETQIKELEIQLANVKQDLEQKEQKELQMRSKIKDLTAKVHQLQNELCSKAQEAKEKYALLEEQSRTKQEKLQEKIHELHATLSKREDDLLSLHKDYQKRNLELTNKVSEQEKMLVGKDEIITKLKDNQIQRKIDEIADESVKQFEDHLRILRRRIKVAEQLQVEVKEWYTNTRKTPAPAIKHNVGLTSVDNVLTSMDGVALNFEECSTNFMNRISNVSCELKFAKDYVKRKKKTMLHMKDDQDCLLAQLDEKEAEILMFRERVWKLEIRERELENLVKEGEEYMLGLKEEKREAIRQLCVWIDYHRSRCDYYKKILTDIKVGSVKTS